MKTIKTKNYNIMVDDDDYRRLNKYRWHIVDNKCGQLYARRWQALPNGKKKAIYMHREILNAPKDKWVDHINRNSLDCRKTNLRLCTPSQNSRNRKKPANAKHKFRGVTTSGDRYVATLKIKGERFISRGVKSELEAAMEYDNLIDELIGKGKIKDNFYIYNFRDNSHLGKFL